MPCKHTSPHGRVGPERFQTRKFVSLVAASHSQPGQAPSLASRQPVGRDSTSFRFLAPTNLSRLHPRAACTALQVHVVNMRASRPASLAICRRCCLGQVRHQLANSSFHVWHLASALCLHGQSKHRAGPAPALGCCTQCTKIVARGLRLGPGDLPLLPSFPQSTLQNIANLAFMYSGLLCTCPSHQHAHPCVS